MAPAIAIVGGGPSGLALAGLLETKGIEDYIVYERSAIDTPPRGSSLDLHPGSGQRVIKEIGAYDLLKKYGRWGGCTLHILCKQNLERVFDFGEGRDAPEVDRTNIRKILLSAIPPQKIRWKTGVTSTKRNAEGEIALQLTDGTEVSGFKLVVGADGAISKVRHLVRLVNGCPISTARHLIDYDQIHSAVPVYSGYISVPTNLSPSNPHYHVMEKAAGEANLVVLGGGKVIWTAPQGNNAYRMELIIPAAEDFPNNTGLDLTDHEASKEFFLRDEHFGTFAPEIREVIKYSEGDWRPWRLYHMPVDCFNWPSLPDVTLIGDAAHVTTPWVGDGVNCAMRDALILSSKLNELGITEEAVAAYEKEMFVWAEDLVSRSIKSGAMFLEKDNPKSLVEFMKTSFGTLVGTTDHV